MARVAHRRFAVTAAAIALVGAGVVVLVVGGRSDPGGTAGSRRAATDRGSATVIVPGRPGEAASVLPADQVTVPDKTTYNEADSLFVRMMIPHHAQGTELASIAIRKARNPQLRAMAERIRIAQDGEIAQLKAWLRARGIPEQIPGHDHGAMRGMQPAAAMEALARADGDGFDRMFVDLMSGHHQGAIDMAGELLKAGKDVEVEKLATDISAEQSIEIARMREVVG
jgi:uncharacterized protein (DUF305 family)